MAGRRPRPNGLRPKGRRLVGVTAALLFASILVGIPSEPAAHAAIGGLTNFEIDGNQVVNGPSPPSGGAGIDWANATSFLQNVGQPTEPCGVNPDPTALNVKLNVFNPFAPNPRPGNINGKDDICQGFIAWQPVEVPSGGVTSTHFVLYGGWQRQLSQTGDMSFFIPLIGGPTKSNVTLVEFDFNPPATTIVSLLRWNGTAWVSTATPANAFDGAVGPAVAPSFGEFAIDLTAAGVIPASGACVSVVSTYVMTRPGNGNADLADYLGVPPVQISNCSPIRITKTTTPAITNGPVDFTYTLKRLDGGPVLDSTPQSAPNTNTSGTTTQINGTLTVPTEPTDVFTNIFVAGTYQLLEDLPPPAPWSHESIVCHYFDPSVLDANLKATPATAVLTNPDGSPTGQTFAVAPVGLLPPQANGNAVDCTITNHAAGLTLAKQVTNDVGNAPATPDMWTLSATPTAPAGPAIPFGPGTTDGVTRPVAPNTYTLSEANNPANPPPAGYAPGPWSCVNAAGNPVPVTGGNTVTITLTDDFTCTITNTAQDLARLTLQKVVNGGTATAADFTLVATQGPTSGAIDGNPISGVTGATAITDRPVLRGLFTLSETGPPGYLPSWNCVNATGPGAINVDATVQFPAEFTDPNQLLVTCTVTNTFSNLAVAITGSAVNPAGTSHTFTFTATQQVSGGAATPLPGALLDLTFTDPSLVTANTCQTPPGTDANGQCIVTVDSNAPGTFSVTVNGFTNEGPAGPNPGQPFPLPTPVSSSKTWTTYRVEADSSVNVVGNASHTFTLRGFRNPGTGETPMLAGTVITYAWNGPGTPSPAGQCTVGADGTCDVTVTNTTNAPASGTLSVTSVIVTLPNGSRNPPPDDVTEYTITGGPALSAPLPAPTKDWIGFRVLVAPTDINLVGQPHTFTVTAEYQTSPGGPFLPVNGGTVDFNWDSSVADIAPTSTCPTLSSAGTCTVTAVQLLPLVPGTGTLTVTGLNDPSVVINGQSTTFSGPIPNGDSASLDLSAAIATKTWVFVAVIISPGADNLASESHTFTVQVTASTGGPPAGVPDAIVTSSVTSTVGGATETGNTCAPAPGTNGNGQCTITVTNPGSGAMTIQLNTVTVTIDGKTFVIPLTPGAPGLERDETASSFQTDKIWWQYRVIMSDSAINPLGVEHTFTATVQRTNDGGATWVAVPPGALLSYDWSDPFGVSSVDTANSTCITTGTIADGTCTFVVTSTAATVGSLFIQGIAATWLDRNRNGQNGGPGSLVEDPAEFVSEIVAIPESQFGTGSVLSASKTWWDFTVDVSGPAENPVGTDHTFNLTVRHTDGFGFQPVSPGTTLTYSWSGPAGSAEDTTRSSCDPANGPGTNLSGQCTVVIASPTVPGTGTLTITGIDSTTIPEPTRQVNFTFPTPGTTTKTWIAYQASILPSATNLAGRPHTFTVTVQQDRGDGNGFVDVPDGTTIAVTLSDPTKLTGSTCSAGTVGGTCTVTVNSNSPGAVTVTPGAITVALLSGASPGATVPVIVQPGSPAYTTPGSATKTWVSVGVSVTPGSATNLVGDSHTFVVHVNVIGADGTTTSLPAPDGATVAWTFDGPGILDAGATTCNTSGTVGGTCAIVFTNGGTPGSGTVNVTSVTFTANGQTFTVDLTAGGPDQATPPPITASKTWVAYDVTVTPSANNPVGTQHNFVITATVDDGTTTPPPPAAGATITFTWIGAGTLLTPSPCTTSASGTCIVSVLSSTAGSGTLTVTSLTDSSGAVVDLTTAGAPGQAANQVVPLEASKTWLQYRVLLETPATNLTGQPHTFIATVQQSAVANPTPADWTAVPNGTTLTASGSGSGSIAPASTCLTGGTTGGTCTFIVHDAGPGTLDLTVTAIATTTVDGAPFTNIALTTPATTSKTWVSAAVSVTPSTATNLVGQTHIFTVHFDVIGADGTTSPQPAPDGSTATSTFNGPGVLDVGATTCNTIGTVAGTCDIVFTNNGTPGSGTLTVTSVTFVANGETFTVDLTSAAPGQATPPPITATKSWVAYTVTVTPAATNPVDRDHQFTIHATRSDGVAVAGATITYTWTGTGTAAPPAQCTTSLSGNCIVTVSSGGAGTGTLTVTSLTDSAGRLVDLTTVDAPGQSAGQEVPLTTTKTWLQYRVLLETAATNLTGVPHTFTATVQQTAVTTPTNADWTAVPNGTTLTASTTGPGTLAPASTCLTGGTTGGTCTFIVHDAGPGTLDLTVTAIDTTTISGAAFTDIALSSPATTSKTWVSVAVSVTPPSSTNIVGQSHTFTVHVDVIGADGTTTPLPAPDGSTVASTFTGPGTPESTCTTPGTSGGTCTVTVTNSGTAGTGTLTIDSVTFTANGEPFTVDLTTPGPGQSTPPPIAASKSWQNYRVTVTPATATNFVDEPHTFTVLVERDTGTGFLPLADAPVTLSSTFTGTSPPDVPTSCTTDSAGKCEITVTSSVPGTLTLTATYDAASDAGAAVPFSGSAEKQWQPGWTLRIVKASSVTDSTQMFAFETTGPQPVGAGSFSLAIGQVQLFEGLLPGTYTVTELTDAAHLPRPWRLQSLVCSAQGVSRGATITTDGPTATLVLAPPNPGEAITCTYTNERMNLFVHKTDGGATPTAGGAPFNYTITVGNDGSVATTEPITVTDTLPAGVTFAGAPQVPAGGSCATPVGQVLTCKLTAPIAPGATVHIIVPARALADASSSVVNIVTIDSPEDLLCPNGACPPPPDCPEPAATTVSAVTLAAITVGGDPTDNQACVRTRVSPESVVGPEAGGSTPPATSPPVAPPPVESPSTGILPRTGSGAMPIALAAICIFWGVAAMVASRRRRARRSA
jgi:hypothetical protein